MTSFVKLLVMLTSLLINFRMLFHRALCMSSGNNLPNDFYQFDCFRCGRFHIEHLFQIDHELYLQITINNIKTYQVISLINNSLRSDSAIVTVPDLFSKGLANYYFFNYKYRIIKY